MTSPLSPESVAQMVADLATKSAMINMGEKIAWGSDSGVMDAAADMLTTLAAENATLLAENEELDFLRHEGGPDSVAAMETELATLRDERDAWTKIDVARDVDFATLRASEAAALDRVAELEAVNRSALDSRTHFKISAGRQKERCHKLRHRQRALLSALETIRFATSLDDAKFKANVAIGGWSDDELIYNARALTPTADKEATT